MESILFHKLAHKLTYLLKYIPYVNHPRKLFIL